MTVDNRTPGRSYLLPNQGNQLKEDVERIITTFGSIDTDVTAMLLELGLKAALVHGHTIAQISGLQSALDDKLSVSGFSLELDNLADVNAPSPAGNQVLMRVASAWIPVSLQVNHVSGLEASLTALADGLATRWNATVVAAALNKTTPVDTDVMPLVDSVLKKVTWANIKATLKTYFDGLYSAVGHAHTFASLTSKPTTIGGFGITDGATDAELAAAIAGNMSGRAYPRRSDGVAFNVSWVGQAGTPTWVLGGSDGVTFQPFSPANFNVAQVGGWTQATIASQIETRAQAWANTRAAIDPGYDGVGAYVVKYSGVGSLGQAVAGSGIGMSGTWRCMGQFNVSGSDVRLFNRIA